MFGRAEWTLDFKVGFYDWRVKIMFRERDLSFIISKYVNIQLRNTRGFPACCLGKSKSFQHVIDFALLFIVSSL